ncbi:MAG: ECF transporter S component [Clostridia bacterium]|nr:ECF transporter S component [Clostridia bacterium]
MENTKNKKNTRKIALSAMLLALSFVLPFFTGQIPEIGAMLCPMHIPVMLCGYICSAPWGFIVGLTAPLLRSVILGMPPLFPTAVAMSFELAAYGFMTGYLFKKLPEKNVYIYINLVISMVVGRVVWGIVMFILMGLNIEKFGFSVFFTSAVVNAIPGIILQLILIPAVVIILKKSSILKKI